MKRLQAFTDYGNDDDCGIFKDRNGNITSQVNVPNAKAAGRLLDLNAAQIKQLERDGQVTVDIDGMPVYIEFESE